MYAIERFGDITLSPFNNNFTLSPVPAKRALVGTTAGVFDGDGQGRARQVFPHSLNYNCVITEDVYENNRPILDTLRAAVGTRAKLYRRARDDNSLQWCTASLDEEPHDWPYTQRGYFEIKFSFEQLSPWLGALHGTGWTFDSGVYFDSGRFFDETPPVALDYEVSAFTLSNDGNLPQHDIRITIRPGDLPINQLLIINRSTACYLVWSGTLPISGTLVIDTGAWSVLNNGADNFNSLTMNEVFHLNQYWFELAPGSNALEIWRTGGDANATATFTFSDLWA